MADMLLAALQRNLETAEAAGLEDKVKKLKARIAELGKESALKAKVPAKASAKKPAAKKAAAPKTVKATTTTTTVETKEK